MKDHERELLKRATAKQDELWTLVVHEMELMDKFHSSSKFNDDQVKMMLERSSLCQHVNAGPQPVFLLAAVDLLLCDDCYQAYVRDPRTRVTLVEEQICDMCKQPVEDNIFAEFIIRAGPLVILGSRGACCFKSKETHAEQAPDSGQ